MHFLQDFVSKMDAKISRKQGTTPTKSKFQWFENFFSLIIILKLFIVKPLRNCILVTIAVIAVKTCLL